MSMLLEGVKYLIPASIVIAGFCLLEVMRLRRRGEGRSPLQWIVLILLGVYLTILFSFTVSPTYGFHWRIRMEEINLNVMSPLELFRENKIHFIENLVMFVPLGAGCVLLSRNMRKLWRTTLLGFCLSVLIECMQLLLIRATDINDVLLNTIGTVMGFLLARMIICLFPNMKNQIGIRKTGTYKYVRRDTGMLYRYLSVLLLTTVLVGFYGIRGVKIDSSFVPEGQDCREQEKFEEVEESAKVSGEKENSEKVLSGLRQEQLSANNICVLDLATGEKIYHKKIEEKIAPASTTKLLTAMVVRRFCDLGEEITVGDELKNVSKDASTAGLAEGDRLNVENMLYAMLLPSGNDAAYSLAAYTGRKILGNMQSDSSDAVAAFVSAMNETAREAGAKQSNFERPDGYDDLHQYTTASDLAVIFQRFIKDQFLREVAGTSSKRCIFADGRDVTYENTNQLIQPESEFFERDVIGGKTGSSSAAGKCLISAGKVNQRLYILVVMGDTEEGRYQDSVRILERLRSAGDKAASK